MSPARPLERPRLDVDEAVQRYVSDGVRLYLGNFGAQLFAVGHAVLRAGRRDLDVVIASGGILLDQLIGAGAVRSAVLAHCWGPVGPSATRQFRRAAEEASGVALHELSLGHLTAALTAGAWGTPFQAVPDLPGTGYDDEDWSGGLLTRLDSPWGPSTAVRAVVPDVAFVHVDAVDRVGNGYAAAPLGEAGVAAQAARHVVLVAETVLDYDGARGITVPGLLVDAVVVHPGAVAPDGAPGRYERDVAAYEDYAVRSATQEGFDDWLGALLSNGRTR